MLCCHSVENCETKGYFIFCYHYLVLFLSKWQKDKSGILVFMRKCTVKENMLGDIQWKSLIVTVMWYAFDFQANMMPLSYFYILCPIFTLHRILLWGQLLQFTSLPRYLHLPTVTTDQDESTKWAAVAGCRNGGLPVPWATKRKNTGEWLKLCHQGWNICRHWQIM